MSYEGSTMSTSGGASERYAIVEGIRRSIEKDEDLVQEAVTHEVPEELQDSGKLKLKKEFGLAGCVASTVGTVVGLGIFGSPSKAMRSFSSLPVVMSLWASYGVFAAFGAISYAAIASTIPISGGDYTYMLKFYGPFGGLAYQVAVNLIIGPVIQGMLATAIAAYFLVAFMGLETYYANIMGTENGIYIGGCIFAALIILFSMMLCSVSTRLVNSLFKVFLGLKFITFSLIVGISIYAYRKNRGIFHSNFEHLNVTITACNGGRMKISEANMQESMLAIMKVIYKVAFSYGGLSSSNYITEEFKVPSKTVKNGILISIPIVLTTYSILLLCYSISLPIEALMDIGFIPTSVFKKWIPNTEIQWVMPILMGICIFGTLLSYTNAVSRVPFVGARHGHTPQIFSLLHLKRLTPIPSLYFHGLLSMLYSPFVFRGWYFTIVQTAVYLEILFSALVVFGFIIWKFKNSPVDLEFTVLFLIHITYCLTAFGILLLPFLSADWSFRHFGCSWQRLLAVLISFIVITAIVLPIYFFLINRKIAKNNCCLSLDRHAMRLCIRILSLGEENYSRNSLLLELEEGEGWGDNSETFKKTLNNASSEGSDLLNM